MLVKSLPGKHGLPSALLLRALPAATFRVQFLHVCPAKFRVLYPLELSIKVLRSAVSCQRLMVKGCQGGWPAYSTAAQSTACSYALI